jgi:hypothetical protein
LAAVPFFGRGEEVPPPRLEPRSVGSILDTPTKKIKGGRNPASGSEIRLEKGDRARSS